MAFEALTQEIQDRIRDTFADLSEVRIKALTHASALSDFFYETVQAHPQLLFKLIEGGDLERAYNKDYWLSLFDTAFSDPPFSSSSQEMSISEVLDRKLREIRRRELSRIIFRDLNHLADLIETTSDLSYLADFSIQTALKLLYQEQCARLGVPRGEVSGDVQEMVVLALGKLGARELNMSSDVDLIFMYDEAGQVNNEGLSNQEFFISLCRKVVHCLSNVHYDGFVFRVDMRLRPYGDSGALILNRNAMEQYYLQQGRDWERYAFIKARPVAGNFELGEDFLQWLSPFVYRAHLDYGAIESLREMKQMINREVEQKNLHDHLKLGPGGIREIEFVVQMNQLIWGGKDPSLRNTRLIDTLQQLLLGEYLPDEDTRVLNDAYLFLRKSEHVIQAEKDQQAHSLPESPLSRWRLTEATGFHNWDDYMGVLDQYRQKVSSCFARLVGSGEAERADLLEGNLHWQAIWREVENEQVFDSFTHEIGFKDPPALRRTLSALAHEIVELHEQGKNRVDKLLPLLLGTIAQHQNPDIILQRVIPIIQAILRRTTYILFLLENLDALKRMVLLCGMSQWLAEQLKTFPILLYELTDKKIDEIDFDRSLLATELESLVESIDEDDLESQMDAMRQFKNSWVLKIAIYEFLDSLVVMKASDALTNIAEILLNKSVDIAWKHLARRHGVPVSETGSQSTNFGVLAYGKLGGLELGYHSDLDLVFIHSGDINSESNGLKPVNANTFFVRLAQRIVHILTSYTQFGILYKVDLRLRPSGNKGPLIATIKGFQRYQIRDAWTWEHQALVRARFVAGDAKIAEAFDEIRTEVLCQKRDPQTLLKEVVSMREKMRAHLSKENSGASSREETPDILVSGFDLKHGIGAIVDIEFMVQYAVLNWSSEFPELVRWTDKMRILDALRKLNLFSNHETEILQQAYLAYRAAVHYQSLGGEMTGFEGLESMRRDVARIWQAKMSRETE